MPRTSALAISMFLISGCGSQTESTSFNKLSRPLDQTGQAQSFAAVPNTVTQETQLPAHWPENIQQAVAHMLNGRRQPLTTEQREVLITKLNSVLSGAAPFSRASNLLKQDSDWIFVLAAFEQTQGVADLLVEGGQDRNVLLDVLSLQGSKVGREQCLEAWRHHRQEIQYLWDKGFFGAESLFMFQRSAAHLEADREYDGWLTDLFSRQGSSLDVAECLYLVIRHGATIRGLLWQNEDAFRSRFRRELWPAMERVLRQTNRPVALYMEQPETVWKVVGMPHGEELLRRFGMIPCVLFYGKHRYPNDLQPEIERLLLSGYASAVEAVCNDQLRRDYQFHQFLREKPLQPVERSVAFQELLAAGEHYPALLDQFISLSAADLEQRFKPKSDLEYWDDSLPSYLKVSKRWLLGQEFDPGDTNHLLTDMAVHGTTIAVGLGVMAMGGDPFSSGGTAGEALRNGINVVQDSMHQSIDADVVAQLEKIAKQREQVFQKINEMTVVNKEAALKESMEDVASLTSVSDLNVLKHENPKIMDIIAVFHNCNPLCRESVSLTKDRKLYFQMRPAMRLALSWYPIASRAELSSADGIAAVMKDTQLGIPKVVVDWWIDLLVVP